MYLSECSQVLARMSGSWPPRLIGHFKKMARMGLMDMGLSAANLLAAGFLLKTEEFKYLKFKYLKH